MRRVVSHGWGGQCRIKWRGAKGAAALGPAVLVARSWWEWEIFMCCI